MLRRTVIVGLVAIVSTAGVWAQAPPEGLPELERTGVVVPWEDFKKLLEQLQRPTPPPPDPRPPVDFALSACEASATVGGDGRSLRVTLGFAVQVLAEDVWVEVPVLGDGVALASATMDGASARLHRSGGAHAVALRGAGSRRFTLEYVVPVEEVRGTWVARLSFPAAPAVDLELAVPRADVDVQVDGAVVREITRRDGGTRVRAALARAGDTTVTWFPRLAASDRESKVFGELATLVSIGEGALRGTTHVALTIHGSGLDTFFLDVPADLTVLDVNAAGLARWELGETAGERRRLRVELAYRAQGSLGFSFDFERTLGDASASLEVPDIALVGVLRERGFVAVAAASNVEITPGDRLVNAAPVDPSELPAVLTAGGGEAVLYAFKHLRHPVEIPLDVVKHADVAVKRTLVERAELVSTLTREGKLATSARFRVTNNRKQFLEIALPEGATVWGASLEGRPVKVAQRADGTLLVPLLKTATGPSGELRPFEVEVVYFADGPDLGRLGRRCLAAPTLDVDVLELEWTLFVPRELRFFGLGGSLDPVVGAHRIVRLGGVAYNLADDRDRAAVAVVERDGVLSLSNGAASVPVDRLELAGADLEILPRRDDGGWPQPGVQRRVAIPDPAPLANEAAPEGEELPSQVAQNVAPGPIELPAGPGGRAVGVLPVRIDLPHDGLRLRLEGRLVVAGEAPTVSAWWVPAAWRLPRLGALETFGFALVLGLALALVLLVDLSFGPRWRWAGVTALLIALGAVLTASSGHRLAFAAALVAAGVLAWVVRRSRERQLGELGGGF